MSTRRDQPDPRARAVTLAIAAGRTGIGVAVIVATARALGALGFPQTDSSGRTLAKLAGGRDIALGALAIAVRDDREALLRACVAGAAVDAGDALSFGVATARGEDLNRAGVLGALSGAVAAGAGAWAASRLHKRT